MPKATNFHGAVEEPLCWEGSSSSKPRSEWNGNLRKEEDKENKEGNLQGYVGYKKMLFRLYQYIPLAKFSVLIKLISNNLFLFKL